MGDSPPNLDFHPPGRNSPDVATANTSTNASSGASKQLRGRKNSTASAPTPIQPDPNMTNIVSSLANLSQIPTAMTEMAQAMRDLTGHFAALKSPRRANNIEEEYQYDSSEGKGDAYTDELPLPNRTISEMAHDIFRSDDSNGEGSPQADGENSDEDETLKAILNSTNTVPEYGVSLKPRIAESFNRIPSMEVSKEQLSQLKETYKVPENCPLLAAPRLNPEIWSHLLPQDRTTDGKVQSVQQLLSLSLVAQARGLELISSIVASGRKWTEEEKQKVFKTTMDSSTCVGMVIQNLNTRRRANIRPLLEPQVANICSNRVPVTQFLFGDNLDSTLKASRLSSGILRRPLKASYGNYRQQRFHPYKRGSGTQSSRPGLSSGSRSLNYRGETFRRHHGPPPSSFSRGQKPPPINHRRQ